MEKNKIDIIDLNCGTTGLNRMKILFTAFLLALICYLPENVLAQNQNGEDEDGYYSEGNTIRDEENEGMLYDELNQRGNKRKKNSEETPASSPSLNFNLNINNDGKIEAELKESIPSETPPNHLQVTDKEDPDNPPIYHDPPEPPDPPDLPIDGGIVYTLIGGVVYASRKILKNKKAA